MRPGSDLSACTELIVSTPHRLTMRSRQQVPGLLPTPESYTAIADRTLGRCAPGTVLPEILGEAGLVMM